MQQSLLLSLLLLLTVHVCNMHVVTRSSLQDIGIWIIRFSSTFFVEKELIEGGHICVQPYQKFSENFQHYWKLLSDADTSVGILSTLPEMDNKNTGKFGLRCLDSLEVWKTAPWKENFSALQNAVLGVIVSVSKDSVQVTCRADNTTVIQDECKKKKRFLLIFVFLFVLVTRRVTYVLILLIITRSLQLNINHLFPF